MSARVLVIGTIIGLVLGSGGVYFLQNSQTQEYLERARAVAREELVLG
jgi:uncharacterized protein (DUF779 family)